MATQLVLFAILASGAAEPEEPARDPGLERMEAYIAELEKPRNTTDEEGLKVSATLVPNYLAYRIGKLYVEARGKGRSHEQAVDQVAEKVEEPKRFGGRAGLKITIENTDHELAGGAARDVRIFTIQEKFPGKVIQLLGHARGGKKGGKRLKTSPATEAGNLRLASVRVKKFYKRGRRGRLDSILSKPFKALVLEKEPASVELLFSGSDLDKYGRFELRLVNLKKYEGPFRADRIDLNDNRRWKTIPAVELPVSRPARGKAIPAELQAVVDAVLGPIR